MAMSYNNPYGMNPYQPTVNWRQPMDQQLYSAAPQQPQRNDGGRKWVQGEAAAKSYILRPNESVDLWDSEAQTIYLKSADANGIPSMRTIDYTFRDQPNMNSNGQPGYSNKIVDGQAREINYATKDDLDSIMAQINNLTMAVNNLANTQQQNTNQQQNQNNNGKYNKEGKH